MFLSKTEIRVIFCSFLILKKVIFIQFFSNFIHFGTSSTKFRWQLLAFIKAFERYVFKIRTLTKYAVLPHQFLLLHLLTL